MLEVIVALTVLDRDFFCHAEQLFYLNKKVNKKYCMPFLFGQNFDINKLSLREEAAPDIC